MTKKELFRKNIELIEEGPERLFFRIWQNTTAG